MLITSFCCSSYLKVDEITKLRVSNRFLTKFREITAFGDGQLAQLAERHPYKVDVAGSTPALPTILLNFPRILC